MDPEPKEPQSKKRPRPETVPTSQASKKKKLNSTSRPTKKGPTGSDEGSKKDKKPPKTKKKSKDKTPDDAEYDVSDEESGNTNIQEQDQEVFEDLVLSENPQVKVPLQINQKLRVYQREGVKFLYGLYQENTGGILGDEMGLGKTIQTIAFLVAILKSPASLRSEAIRNEAQKQVQKTTQKEKEVVDLTEDIPEDIPEDVPEDPEDSEDISEDFSEDISEEILEESNVTSIKLRKRGTQKLSRTNFTNLQKMQEDSFESYSTYSSTSSSSSSSNSSKSSEDSTSTDFSETSSEGDSTSQSSGSESDDSSQIWEKKVDNKLDWDQCKPAMLVVPATVVHQWKKEIVRWGNLAHRAFRVGVYWGATKERDAVLKSTQAGDIDILLTTYEVLRKDLKDLNLPWEVVVFDEVHKIKGLKSKTRIACMQLKATRRLGLTGTVMQNNFEELWSLLDFVRPGYFGTIKEFRKFYISPIKLAHRNNASEDEIVRGRRAAVHLNRKIKKVVLRRDKSVIQDLLPGKRDSIVFCPLTTLQFNVYQRVLNLPEFQALIKFAVDRAETAKAKADEIQKRKDELQAKKDIIEISDESEEMNIDPSSFLSSEKEDVAAEKIPPEAPPLQEEGLFDKEKGPDLLDILEQEMEIAPLPVPVEQTQVIDAFQLRKSVFPAITTLLKIANHIQLLEPTDTKNMTQAQTTREFFDRAMGDEKDKIMESLSGTGVEVCGKLKALQNLLEMWHKAGRKVLVFSYATKMLDILERFVKKCAYRYQRLDGRTAMEDRGKIIEKFNADKKEFLFLISTKAGGLGINLASANIVVVFDTSWNVSHDLQAQDRAYRIGQTRFTEVYRFVSVGTIEEMVYNRQVYKQQLASIGLEGNYERRYFTGVAGVKGQEGEIFGLLNLLKHNATSLTSELFKKAKEEEKGYIIEEGQHTEEKKPDGNSDQALMESIFLTDVPSEDEEPEYTSDILDLSSLKQRVQHGFQRMEAAQSMLFQSGVSHQLDHRQLLGNHQVEEKIFQQAEQRVAQQEALQHASFLYYQQQQQQQLYLQQKQRIEEANRLLQESNPSVAHFSSGLPPRSGPMLLPMFDQRAFPPSKPLSMEAFTETGTTTPGFTVLKPTTFDTITNPTLPYRPLLVKMPSTAFMNSFIGPEQDQVSSTTQEQPVNNPEAFILPTPQISSVMPLSSSKTVTLNTQAMSHPLFPSLIPSNQPLPPSDSTLPYIVSVRQTNTQPRQQPIAPKSFYQQSDFILGQSGAYRSVVADQQLPVFRDLPIRNQTSKLPSLDQLISNVRTPIPGQTPSGPVDLTRL